MTQAYEVKCDDCKTTIGTTDSVGESAKGGYCEKCRPATSGREILVHLNVTAPAGDDRSADEVADAILGAIEVGSDDDSVRDLIIVADA